MPWRDSEVITGRAGPEYISTSYVERQNWTVRITMRRYARLSDLSELVDLLIEAEKKAA